MESNKIELIQNELKKRGIDGWLLYDFRRSNPLALEVLGIDARAMLTRRFFVLIPKEGEVTKWVSSVEDPLKTVPGKNIVFKSWRELNASLREELSAMQTIAMEYSPMGAIPEISKVDAGTIELISSFGKTVVSSGDLLQIGLALFDERKWRTHRFAAAVLDETAKRTFQMIKEKLSRAEPLFEEDVQCFMMEEIKKKGCVSEHPPIAAVNQHSAYPHYSPRKGASQEIKRGDWILIDLWCRQDLPGSAYADITRVAVASKAPTKRQEEIFSIVREAQKKALSFVEERVLAYEAVQGFEVDQAARSVIEKAGYGPYFIHRLGHNIDEKDHGPGAHLDDLETHDERALLPGTCFSIEPGIYLPEEFGVRLEHDVFITLDLKVVVTGGIQEKIVTLF